jgi:hypothetical protein
VKSITFTAEPEIAERLEKLCRITKVGSSELINLLLESPLEQVFGLGDNSLLRAGSAEKPTFSKVMIGRTR